MPNANDTARVTPRYHPEISFSGSPSMSDAAMVADLLSAFIPNIKVSTSNTTPRNNGKPSDCAGVKGVKPFGIVGDAAVLTPDGKRKMFPAPDHHAFDYGLPAVIEFGLSRQRWRYNLSEITGQADNDAWPDIVPLGNISSPARPRRPGFGPGWRRT